MYASKETHRYEVASNTNIPIYCILTRQSIREKNNGFIMEKILKYIELLKKGVKGCRCASQVQRNTQSLFLPIVIADMFVKKNRSFSQNLKLLGSRLACQGCSQCPCVGLSRKEFWEAKLNQMIRARRSFSEASFVCSGLHLGQLWIFGF